MRDPIAGNDASGGVVSAGVFDVFVSYGHGDAEWAEVLADNLSRLGLAVWQDRYELVRGDLLAQRLQEGEVPPLSWRLSILV